MCRCRWKQPINGVLDVMAQMGPLKCNCLSLMAKHLKAGFPGTPTGFEFEPVVDGTTLSLSDLIVVGQGGLLLVLQTQDNRKFGHVHHNDGDDLCERRMTDPDTC